MLGKEINTITMRGSNSNWSLNNDNTTLQNELELLLLQQQRNRSIVLERERERELDINRSGSAPPTVEGAARSLFTYPHIVKIDGNSNNNNNGSNICVLTEAEILSHPTYLEYYYSNENLNPRLPPPLLSREDWRVAQRVRAAGFGLDPNPAGNASGSSLFSMQPGLSVRKVENDMMELRRAALINLSRKNSSESLDKYSSGLLGGSSSGMGVRRKSFADILQEGTGQLAKSHLSRTSSHNSVADALEISKSNSAEIRKSESFEREKRFTGSSGMNSSLSSPRPELASPRNFPPPGIFEIADIAASLYGLNMSEEGQLHAENILKSSSLHMGIHKQNQHYYDGSRAENLINNMNYVHLTRNNRSSEGLNNNTSKAVMNEGVSLPRRTASTNNLHSQLEDLKLQRQGSNFPGVNMRRSGNSIDQGSLLAGANATGLHFPVIDPHQIQYMQKMPNHGRDFTHLSGSSGHENFQALEKAYLEALLLQQTQQYQSHFLQNHSNISHQYHESPSFGPSYQGNLARNAQDSRVNSRSSMLQNEITQMPSSTLRSPKGESTLHSQSGSSSKARFESLLEVLKNNKSKSLELSDIIGHVVEFSTDQFGSRFIQQKLESATVEEKTKILTEIIPTARGLMIDVFGNYVIQKFFEHGTESQRKELATHLIGHVLPLTLQMYGCRVVQKALEVVDVELQSKMVAELDGSVMKCVHDQNGNHVIQKCIECVPQDRIQFIISSFFGQVVTLSSHPYGCRVIQRVLEHCSDPKTQEIIMGEIMGSVCKLAQDQYGNYVIQHVVQHGKPNERAVIIGKLAGQIVKMSQQKFASNVVEKCLTFGGPEERKLLVNEMLGSTDENEPLQAMMKDPFGNYVVQKVLETCDDKSRELIISRIKVHLNALKKYTYGKHIVSRVEKLIATGERHIGQSSKTS